MNNSCRLREEWPIVADTLHSWFSSFSHGQADGADLLSSKGAHSVHALGEVSIGRLDAKVTS